MKREGWESPGASLNHFEAKRFTIITTQNLLQKSYFCDLCEIIFSILPTHDFPWIGVFFSLSSPGPKFWILTVFSLGKLFSEYSFIVETSNYVLATIVNVIMSAMTENCDLSKLAVSCIYLMLKNSSFLFQIGRVLG